MQPQASVNPADMEEVSGVLEAQVPSVPRSHRSPQGIHGSPQGIHGFPPGIPGNPYMDIHIWGQKTVIYGEKTQHTDFDQS